ncbi:MAG: hypothetical protein N2053_07280 [Chitinispirillaceae bacterium]|nr:hypothetical protein [Chitinispirillaceae bacterium]
MKGAIKIIVGATFLFLLFSCVQNYEQKGDAAYNKAKKLSGYEKRIQQKTAYMFYDKAVKKNPNKISNKLRNRYIEMTLERASMMLNEGAAHLDGIHLLLGDVEKLTTPDVSPELKQRHALLIVQLADTSLKKGRIQEAKERFEKAIAIASDPEPIKAKRRSAIDSVAKAYLEEAQVFYTNGKTNKDEEDMVRAEFYVLSSLLFDSSNADAKKLLSDLRKENLGTYSAYLKVIDPIPDSAIFKIVNKWDILFALPVVETRGNTVKIVINMYNYSWNPLRLKSEHFYLVDVNGKRYKANTTRIDPDILDQEHETKFTLTFPKPAAPIKKLLYENGEHVSEKEFI